MILKQHRITVVALVLVESSCRRGQRGETRRGRVAVGCCVAWLPPGSLPSLAQLVQSMELPATQDLRNSRVVRPF